jgi:phospholipid transport system transporter-binding protein
MLVLPAELTHAQARAGWRCCARPRRPSQARGRGRRHGAGALRFSALAVLLACAAAAGTPATRCVAGGLAPRLRTLAGLYGVDALLPDAAPAA